MGFSLASLLVHHDAVPPAARAALRAVTEAPDEHRTQALERAASVLYRETELDCEDVRELVGLGDSAYAPCDSMS